MVKCTFCGSQIEKGTGKMLVKNNSNINYYCKNKCEKNHLKLRRIPRKIKWTEEHHIQKSSQKITTSAKITKK